MHELELGSFIETMISSPSKRRLSITVNKVDVNLFAFPYESNSIKFSKLRSLRERSL